MPAPNLPLYSELKDAAEAGIQLAQPDLNDFRAGSNLDALTGGMAIVADTVIYHGLVVQRECFTETAEGVALERLITSRGGPARLDATAATTPLTLTRGSYSGSYTMSAGHAVTGTSADGSTITFTVTTTTTLGGAASSALIPVTCSETGPDGNVAAGTLISSSLPTGLTLTQPSRAAGGNVEETDLKYLSRYKLFLRARQQGTPEALEFAARTVAGIRFAAVDESAIQGESGHVTVYVADSTGEGSSELAALATTAIDTTVIDGRTGARGAGVQAVVVAAVREEIAIEVTVTVRSAAITEDMVADAVVDFMATLDPGALLYQSALEEAIRQISNDVLDAEQTVPSAATAPTQRYNSLRTADDGSDVTVTIVVAS